MRSCARFDIPSNWWPRRPDRRSGPPRPRTGRLKHLREAIDILEETAPTKDQREEIQRAVELLDQLIKVIRRDHNPVLVPDWGAWSDHPSEGRGHCDLACSRGACRRQEGPKSHSA